MSTEHGEGQSPRLFPIPRATVDMSVGTVKYMVKNGRDDLFAKLFSRYTREFASAALARHFNQQFERFFSPADKTFFSLGVAVSLDSIALASQKQAIPVPKVWEVDMMDFARVRAKLVDETWTGTSPEIRHHYAQNLRMLFKPERDGGMYFATEAMRDLYPDNRDVKASRDFAFMLGLSDTYFPVRYAEDRRKMKEGLDQ